MRIGMIAPISWRTPPRRYGPWEYATSLLTEALVAGGEDVTLFATADSKTKGTLKAICPRPYSEDPSFDAKVWEALHIAYAFEHARDFDILHNQADFIPLAFSRLVETPLVTTIHGFSSPRILPVFQAYDDHTYYVSISNADRHPSLNYVATIHHGIPLGDFPFSAEGGEHLLFYGRIHPDKGAAEAVEAARRTGHQLVMAGIVHDETYFRREVEPHIDGRRVIYNGAVGGADRARTLGGASALLHLINFNEPFGFSIIEALACGTPVIAIRRGSMPELIEDGVTGFLVNSVEEAIDAIGRIGEIDRRACRAAAEERFSVERMARDYRDVYCAILNGDIKPNTNTPG